TVATLLKRVDADRMNEPSTAASSAVASGAGAARLAAVMDRATGTNSRSASGPDAALLVTVGSFCADTGWALPAKVDCSARGPRPAKILVRPGAGRLLRSTPRGFSDGATRSDRRTGEE